MILKPRRTRDFRKKLLCGPRKKHEEITPESVKDALNDMKDVMDDMELRSASIVELTEGALTFSEGKTAVFCGRTYPVPDGFESAEDGDTLVLFLPNPENPEEWEASATLLLLHHDGIMLHAEAKLPGHDEVTREKVRDTETAYHAQYLLYIGKED